MRPEFLRQTDRKWSELRAAEGCCRLLRFNREEQQRYQWLTTAGSASCREQRLMDGEHDIDFSTVQPHNSLDDIWYLFYCTCPVWTNRLDMTHRSVEIKKKARGHVSFFFFYQSCEMCFVLILQIRNASIWHSTDRACTRESASDNTFPYAIIISSLRRSFCLDS